MVRAGIQRGYDTRIGAPGRGAGQVFGESTQGADGVAGAFAIQGLMNAARMDKAARPPLF